MIGNQMLRVCPAIIRASPMDSKMTAFRINRLVEVNHRMFSVYALRMVLAKTPLITEATKPSEPRNQV